MQRRQFLKSAAASAAIVSAAASVPEALKASKFAEDRAGDPIPSKSPNMISRTLGKTGEQVSAIGLGGAHIGGGGMDDEQSIALIRAALDRGINFLDNCWDYNHGNSEVRMGKALRDGYRQKAFLMTKIDGRTRQAAAKQIDECLTRLQTDHIDLMQFHEIIRMEDPDRVFAPGGAMEAMLAAQKAGKVRYIGFTGHKDPAVHLRMLDIAAKHDFHFDAAQMPLNVMDAHFRSFEHLVVPRLVKEGTAVLAMKTLGGRFILQSKTVTAMECLQYALNLPTSVVITGIDSTQILEQAFEVARSFRPMTEQQVAVLLAKTKDAAVAGAYEFYKTSNRFDGTARNPDWLG